MTRAWCIGLLTAALLPVQMDAAEWWPQFRGSNSAGTGDGTPPVEFGADRGLVWKIAVGSGISSPVIWGERIFLTEFDRSNKQLATVCIDRPTGRILWRRTVTPPEIERVHEISNPAAPTPVTDGERVYVYFGSYGLVAYDLKGNQQWEKRLPWPTIHMAWLPLRLSPPTCS